MRVSPPSTLSHRNGPPPTGGSFRVPIPVVTRQLRCPTEMAGHRVQESRSVRVEPMVRWWQRRHPPHQRAGCVCTLGGWCASVESLARRVEVSHSTMYRRLRLGYIDLYEADRWAVACGLHPSRIWVEFDRIDCEEVHAADDCDEVQL